MKNYGWANDEAHFKMTGGEDAIALCRKKGHHPTDADEGPQYRGMKHHVVCRDCDYEYFYDSSD